jgi:heterodisulfide reductase subunit C2
MSTDNQLTNLDTSFKDKVAAKPGGEGVKVCFSCGVCTAACPVNSVEAGFNPRQMIRSILIGDKEGVLASNLIWLCFLCERCYANCPQNVNFAHITRALREIAVAEGYADLKLPELISKVDTAIQKLRKDALLKILDNSSKIESVDLTKILKEAINKI